MSLLPQGTFLLRDEASTVRKTDDSQRPRCPEARAAPTQTQPRFSKRALVAERNLVPLAS
jgi:hypothetical protein